LDECEEKVVRTGDRIPVEPTRRRTAAKPASVSICRLTRASLRPVKSGAITIWFPASTPMRKPRTARSTVDVGTFEQHPQPVGRNAITSRKVAVCREKSLAAVSGWRDHGPSRLKRHVDMTSEIKQVVTENLLHISALSLRRRHPGQRRGGASHIDGGSC
jgi:hypothetical protein